jgi:TRAP-type C4-dicarboxylate transport system substrate-binding protein
MIKYLMSALVAVLAFSGSAQSQEVTLRMSAFIPAQAPTFAQVMKPWADAINAEGKGIIKIDAFPGGALGGNPGLQPKMVNDGVADIALVIPAYSPGRFPDNDVMELPRLVNNSTESSQVIYRLYKRGLLRGYDDFYVVMLSTTNPYAVHTKKPVKTIADIKGLKLRAGGPVSSAAMRALGAVPVGMPITEVAENVSRGVIDGAGGDWDVMYSFRIIEAAKHHYMAAALGTVPVAILMNKKVYDGLPAKAKALIDKHSGEIMSKRFGAVHDGVQANRLEETKKAADQIMVFPPDAELAKWDATMAPVISEWVKGHPNGDKLFAAMKEELAKVRAGK